MTAKRDNFRFKIFHSLFFHFSLALMFLQELWILVQAKAAAILKPEA
jgi:hypothetical protein